ncbi:hypothetical protein [Haladaptatus sp. NG-WS-4]
MQVGRATLALFVLGVAASGFGSTLAGASQSVVLPTADVEYTCENVTVSVEPEWVNYSLVITYRDTVTDDEGKALVGPLNGTVTEPYGPEFVFTSVEVLVGGATVETGYVPLRCLRNYSETSVRTRSERSDN